MKTNMSVAPKDKLSASLEDYLEAIFHLAKKHTVARSKDIADELKVSRASVTGALRMLSERNLIHYKPYGMVTLTEQGEAEADKIVRRHSVLESFFVEILGLDPELAKESACRAEHALGQQVVGRLRNYIEFISTRECLKGVFPVEFERYCQQQSGDALSEVNE